MNFTKIQFSTFYLLLGSIALTPLVFFSQESQAQNISAPKQPNQCFASDQIPALELNSAKELKITSNSVTRKKNQVQFLGNVLAHDNSKAIQSNKINYDMNTGEIKTKDPSVFNQGNFRFSTRENASYNTKTKRLSAGKSNFEIPNTKGSGSTNKLYSSPKITKNLILEDASFTYCNPKNPSWLIESSKAEILNKEQRIILNNAVFKISDIPVLWLPYLSLPLNNRASGLLFPVFRVKKLNNKSYYQYAQPYYFNLAPNRDLTTTLIKDSQYGDFLANEFRFLEKNTNGNLKLHWLANKKVNSSNLTNSTNSERWFLNYQQNGKVDFNNRPLYLKLNLARVSDINYINQYNPFNRRNTTRLMSNLSLTQKTALANVYVNFQDSQRLQSNGNYYIKKTHLSTQFNPIDLGSNWTSNIGIDYARFTREDEKIKSASATGDRFNTTISVGKKYATQGYSVTPEVKFIDKRYQLDKNSLSNRKTSLANQYFVFKLDNKLMLQRKLDSGIRQDLDLRVLFITANLSEAKQKKLPVFDSSLLGESSYLFRDNRYAGKDRRSKEKKLALSVTTAFFKQKNSKRMADFQIAQAYYFFPYGKYINSNGNLADKNYSDIYLGSNFFYKSYVLSANVQIDATSHNYTNFKSYRISFSQSKFNPKFRTSYFENRTYRLLTSNIEYQLAKNKISINSIYSFVKNRTENFGMSLFRNDCCYKIGASLSRIRRGNNLFESQLEFFIEFKGLANLSFR